MYDTIDLNDNVLVELFFHNHGTLRKTFFTGRARADVNEKQKLIPDTRGTRLS